MPGTPDAGVVFDALGDPTRRGVLEAVAALGPVTATELAGRFPVTRQAVVKHLNALAAAGLVVAERHGREVRYRFVRTPLDGATAWLAGVGQAWDDRLARLRAQLGEGGSGQPGVRGQTGVAGQPGTAPR